MIDLTISDIRHSARLLLLMAALLFGGAGCAWAQTAPEGTWYIKSGDYHLCPGINSYYDEAKDQPHLTTYKTGEVKNSIWRIVKATDEGCYYVIHNATGKYLTANDAKNSDAAKQLRVHLEATDSPTDKMLFKFEASGTAYGIYPKAYTTEADYYLNAFSGNKDSYAPNGNSVADGMIGFNAKALSGATKWTLVAAPATCADPVIKYADGQFTITYPTAAEGATIHYTTDGSEPTASSPTYSEAIPEADVKMVRAIAVKDGYTSSAVADFFSPSHAFLFKTMDAANQSYYMVAPLDDSYLSVTTSNVPNARMGWLLELAERSGDIDYYYFKNQATGQYLYCKATNTNKGEGSALVMKALDETDAEPERYKFRLWRIDGNYYIVPQKYAYRPPTDIQNGLTKQNKTDHTNPIGMYMNTGDGRSWWQFIPVPDDPRTLSAVSMVSTDESTLYWKIQCVADNTFYVCPPAGTDRVATAQKTGERMEWFLEQATDADPWVTYYHIRNGETGEYLYFKGIGGQEKTFYVTSTEASGSDDGFKFIVVRTANASATDSYNIIPKALKDQPNQVNNSLNRNNTTLRTLNSRDNNNSQWNFVEVTDFVSPPDITYDNGQITLTCNTKGADIFYTTDGSDPATSSTRKAYTAAFTPTNGTVNTIKACATKGTATSTVRTKTINLTTYTQGYYALHLNGTGYLKVNGGDVALSNDGTFQSGNLFDKGNSIWVITPEGYLQNEYYYLNVANNRTLYLSVTPETRWTLEDVANSTKKHLYINDGTQNLYLCNDGGIKVSGTTTKYYSACPMTVTELENGWSGPTTDALTLLSPQQVTYLRHYFTQKISYSFTNDADGSVSNTNNTRRIYATLEYSSTSEAGKGSTWNIKDNIIYNKQTSGNVDVTATYKMLPADPIARSQHNEAVKKDLKFTLQPKAFGPTADTDYLLFHTNNGNFRFPYDDGITEGQPVKPYGTQSQLTWDPKNPELSWRIETDSAGFVMFKNVKTDRYLYFDASDYTNSDYGAVKVGATSVPDGADGTKYKFRLFKLTNHDTYGSNIVSIIPYEKQFVIFKNDGRSNNIFGALWADTNNRVLTLNKPAEYMWKFYPYEVEDKYCLKTDYGIGIPKTIQTGLSATITAEGTYDLTAESYHWLNIKGAPGNNNTDLDAGKGTKKDILYQWEITGEVADYIETLQFEQTGVDKSTFKVNVTSMPEAAISGKLKVTASVSSPEALTAPVEIALNIAPPLNYEEPTDFEEITSLSAIIKQNGHYRLTADATDRPSVEDFKGVLDGGMHTVSGLSASLFKTLSGAAVVRNLRLEVSTINGDGPQGAVAGQALGNSRIYNVGVLSGSIGSTNDCCGGLVGSISGMARVINCYSFADITGGTDVGGLVGYNDYASTSADIKTMVMNCMFYGNITGGTNVSPIYGGKIIRSNYQSNTDAGINNYNYYRFNSNITGTNIVYNCALAAEDRFLNRFEFYRQMLNSNRELAAWYVFGSTDNARTLMAKWVLETADRTKASPKPYPVLKTQGKYPSIINYDAEHAPETTAEANHGAKLGTLTVYISDEKTTGGQTWPADATINADAKAKAGLTLQRTDKDYEHFNFNYDKVQLPYYNDVGTGNYTNGRVVTGWKITNITGGTTGSFTTGSDIGSDGKLPYNFADRDCTDKDLYSVSGRVFSQGAYFDVPNGVTAITIEPYWAQAVYLSDARYDKTYNSTYGNATDFAATPVCHSNNTEYPATGSGQKVYTNLGTAIDNLSRNATVYDYAVVLVGNYHAYYGKSAIKNDKKPFTIMSVDNDGDNEPDYSFIYQHQERQNVSPIRFDFLNWIGVGMAQKAYGSLRMPNIGIFKPQGWFEVTNTCIAQFFEIEYDNGLPDPAPFILQGGVVEQIVSGNNAVSGKTQYLHIGGNAWFKMFNNGTHTAKDFGTPHIPISVTGGDFDSFYLSGMFRPNVSDSKVIKDSAECYISGGRFGEVAGAGQEQIKGSVTWQIDHADIANFYGGGINDGKPVLGNISVTIKNSHVGEYCGGPKFGNISTGKTVTTNASDCTFGTYFGAGFGGTSFFRQMTKDITTGLNYSFNGWVDSDYPSQDKAYAANQGIATNFEYELFAYAGFSSDVNVGRFYVNYASLSTATTHDVTSTLKDCVITGNFYGGGSLGKVEGNVTSTLTNCKVGGNVFGAGFSATVPSVDVMPKANYQVEPQYNGEIGAYTIGVPPASTPYTWSSKGSTSAPFTDDAEGHWIHTDENLKTLGTVSGKVTLVLDNGTTVSGNVYGGGDESKVEDSDVPANAQTAVTIKGGSQIAGDVFGGGNNGDVSGSTTVNIEN